MGIGGDTLTEIVSFAEDCGFFVTSDLQLLQISDFWTQSFLDLREGIVFFGWPRESFAELVFIQAAERPEATLLELASRLAASCFTVGLEVVTFEPFDHTIDPCLAA